MNSRNISKMASKSKKAAILSVWMRINLIDGYLILMITEWMESSNINVFDQYFCNLIYLSTPFQEGYHVNH